MTSEQDTKISTNEEAVDSLKSEEAQPDSVVLKQEKKQSETDQNSESQEQVDPDKSNIMPTEITTDKIKEEESSNHFQELKHEKSSPEADSKKEIKLGENDPKKKESSLIHVTLNDSEVNLPMNKSAAEKMVEKMDQKTSGKKNATTKVEDEEEEKEKKPTVNNEKSSHENSNMEGTAKASTSKQSTSKQTALTNRNLWITNISRTTRATVLSQTFSQYGKVIGAKVVTDANHPGSCCFGYVTMGTVEEANECIKKLDNTELNGKIIHIRKTRPDQGITKKTHEKGKLKAVHKEEEHKKVVLKNKFKKDDGHKSDSSSGRKRDFRKSLSPKKNDKETISPAQKHDGKVSSQVVLTFDKIKEERERQRIRNQERILREESRRHREEAIRQKETERENRREAARLEKERMKIRLERVKLEKAKIEMIGIERERQKLERQKLELEKMELERVKLRLQEERRSALKRSASFERREEYEPRKRGSVGERRFENQSKFQSSNNIKSHESSPAGKKFALSTKGRPSFEKREAYPSKRERYEDDRSHQVSAPVRATMSTVSKYEGGNSLFGMNRERTETRPSREVTVQQQPIRIPKEARYIQRERERSPHFRNNREERERRSLPEHKEVRNREHRYSDNVKEDRFARLGNNSSWGHQSTPGVGKNFSSNSPATASKTWGKAEWGQADNSGPERWNSSGGSRGGLSMNNSGFSSGSSITVNPQCPPPPQIKNYPSDRFDYGNMGNLRKYQ